MTPTRQQTLRASLDWSHALLTVAEQRIFRRLAVFSGGCELDAAERVCAPSAKGSTRTLDLMTGLVDKSFVVVDTGGSTARYRLLEPVRQYAQERLEAANESGRVKRMHATYYAELAEHAASHLHGTTELAWLGRLDADRDNLRAALNWAQSEANVEMQSRLAVALVPFWEVRGHLVEGRRWLEQVLSVVETGGADAELRLQTQIGAGRLAFFQADLDGALALFRRGVVVARQLQQRRLLAEALTWVGATYRRRGDWASAEATLRQSLALHETLHDVTGAAWAYMNMALLTVNLCDIDRSDWAQARPLIEAALARYRALSDMRGVGLSALVLGSVLARLGEHERTIGLLDEGLAGLRAMGDRSYLLPCLLTVASVAAELGQPRRAARLLGAAEALGDLLGATGVAPVNRADEALALNAMRGRLSVAELESARAEGRTLAPDAAVLEAQAAVRLLAGGDPASTSAPLPTAEGLTRREENVARLLRAGYTDRQIALALGIAPGTATVHVHHVLNKLRVRSRWQLVDRRQVTP